MQSLHITLRNPLPDCLVIWVKKPKVLIQWAHPQSVVPHPANSPHPLPAFLARYEPPHTSAGLTPCLSLMIPYQCVTKLLGVLGKHLDIVHEAQVAYDSVAVIHPQSPRLTSEPRIGVQLTGSRARVKGSLPVLHKLLFRTHN